MKVAVIGLGKIGLPLAVQFASAGYPVVGLDVVGAVVGSVNRGLAPFPGEPGLQALIREYTAQGALRASLNVSEEVESSNVVVVAVPLVVDNLGSPSFHSLDSAMELVGRGLQRGSLVCIETTLPVGTTRLRLTPALEHFSGLKAGADFSVAFSPERVSSGSVFRDLVNYPKLVGGIDEESGKKATEFYEQAISFEERSDLNKPNGVWDLGTSEAAEFAKLAETTYRDVNIGLANQFARYADRLGLDIYSILEACNSQPYSHIHRPGIAVGGHCIPVYPHLYMSGDHQATIVQAARQVNEQMPRYAVDVLEAHLGSLDRQRVAILGAAYRGGVKETAFSGVFPLKTELISRGADVTVHDPLFTATELAELGLEAHELGNPCDAAILQADHVEYADLTQEMFPGLKVMFDGRGAIENPETFSVPVVRIGRL